MLLIGVLVALYALWMGMRFLEEQLKQPTTGW
jgi:hypothetical protein